MKKILILLIISICFTFYSCNDFETVNTYDDKEILPLKIISDSGVYICENVTDLKNYIIESYLVFEKQVTIPTEINITTTLEGNINYYLVSGKFLSSGKLSPFTLILSNKVNTEPYQINRLELRHIDPEIVSPSCLMFCNTDGKCTTCLQEIIEKCKRQTCTCSSGNGGCSPVTQF
jgi:hypothetical protein